MHPPSSVLHSLISKPACSPTLGEFTMAADSVVRKSSSKVVAFGIPIRTNLP